MKSDLNHFAIDTGSAKLQGESQFGSFFVQSSAMSGEGESNATSAPKDEFDALPLFVQRVTRPPRPPTAQAKKTADNGASSSTGSKESVIQVSAQPKM